MIHPFWYNRVGEWPEWVSRDLTTTDICRDVSYRTTSLVDDPKLYKDYSIQLHPGLWLQIMFPSLRELKKGWKDFFAELTGNYFLDEATPKVRIKPEYRRDEDKIGTVMDICNDPEVPDTILVKCLNIVARKHGLLP